MPEISAWWYVYWSKCYMCGKAALVCSGTGCCAKCDDPKNTQFTPSPGVLPILKALANNKRAYGHGRFYDKVVREAYTTV